MAAKRGVPLFCQTLPWLIVLIVLVKVAKSVARELHSVGLGVMAAGLTLLLAIALWSSLPSRRR